MSENDFFEACGTCEAACWLASTDQATGVDFGQSVAIASRNLKDQIPLPEEALDAELARALRLSRLSEDVEGMLKSCIKVHIEGRCNAKVEHSKTVQVNEQYL